MCRFMQFSLKDSLYYSVVSVLGKLVLVIYNLISQKCFFAHNFKVCFLCFLVDK